MKLNEIYFSNFRNYEKQGIKFHPKQNIFVGHNGAGKTNILEAIYFSATTRSPRTSYLYDLIQWGKEEFYIKTLLQRNNMQGEIEHTFTRNGNREIQFNKIPKKIWEIMELIPFVYFMPEDMMIIKGEASIRRRALDLVLFQIYPHYKYMMQRLRRALLERNACLKKVRDNIYPESSLDEWDKSLVENGIKIYQKRKDLIEKINFFLISIGKTMFHNQGELKFIYKDFLDNKQEITEDSFYKELIEKRKEEIRAGITLVGPHREDIIFDYNEKDLKKFGSQGQQRSAVLSFKAASAQVLKQELNEHPIIIFDDVFSELDSKKREALLEILDNDYQMFFTSVSVDDIKISSDNFIFNVNQGNVCKV
jgi:DNA replication and repair protein RecF